MNVTSKKPDSTSDTLPLTRTPSQSRQNDPITNLDCSDTEYIESVAKTINFAYATQEKSEQTPLTDLSSHTDTLRRDTIPMPWQGYVRMLSEQAIDESACCTISQLAQSDATTDQAKTTQTFCFDGEKSTHSSASKRSYDMNSIWKIFKGRLKIQKYTAMPTYVAILLIGMIVGAFLYHNISSMRQYPVQSLIPFSVDAVLRLDDNAEIFAKHTTQSATMHRSAVSNQADKTN